MPPLVRYTPADSALARTVVTFRKKRRAAGEKAMKERAFPDGKEISPAQVYRNARKTPALWSGYVANQSASVQDTTMSKALKDVKASQSIGNPLDRDVTAARKITFQKKKKK